VSRLNSGDSKGSYIDYEASLIRLALTELKSEEDDSDIDISDEEIIKKRDESYEDFMRQIDAEIARRKKNRFFERSLPRIVIAAASILLVCFMGFTTAVAFNDSVRVRVLEFLINITPEYTELSIRENVNLTFYIPTEWEGRYYPSYMPSSFSTYEIDCMPDNHDVYYDLGDGKYFEFAELGESTEANIDTENADVRTIKIGNAEGMLVQKRDSITIAWANEEKFFILSGNIEEAELTRIARSVKLIM
jgi:hypothetical protein